MQRICLNLASKRLWWKFGNVQTSKLMQIRGHKYIYSFPGLVYIKENAKFSDWIIYESTLSRLYFKDMRVKYILKIIKDLQIEISSKSRWKIWR